MAAVIMPNPQEFNQAARDDKGRRRERTVYSYARGLTDHRRDENKRSGTTTYLRPPGQTGFPSGAAITWADDCGRLVTVFRVAWVPADCTGAEQITANTIYGFVHSDFDLTRLNGLAAVRDNASPLTKGTLGNLIDPERGDLVDSSQSRIHAKMRSTMSMGRTDESQKLAMQLLRRAQASKGIFNINALFKEFVLTEPLAMARWDTALTHYREASKLYDEFEYARTRLDTLKKLPYLAERYTAAGRDYVAKSRLLERSEAGLPSRLDIWHAGKIEEWASTEIDTNRLERGLTDDKLQDAQARNDVAKRAHDDVLDTLVALGGDPTQTIRLQLDQETKNINAIQRTRDSFTERLCEFQLSLPTSRGDLTLLRESMTKVAQHLGRRMTTLNQQAHGTQAEFGGIRKQIATLTAEIEKLKQRPGNIPPDAVVLRARIAQDTGVPVERLPYIGELMQIRPEHRRWERAVHSVLRGLAADLLVAEADLPDVRGYVNSNDMGRSLTLARARSISLAATPIDNTIPALLDIADSPFRPWLLTELVKHFSYWCVEDDIDLDTVRPPGTAGAVTRAGMRTAARDRYVKNDRRSPYSWIGWDNQGLREELTDQVSALRREAEVAAKKAEAATDARDACRDSIKRLDLLREEIDWTKIEIAPARQRKRDLEDQLTRADTPEIRDLRDKLDKSRKAAGATEAEIAGIEKEQNQLDSQWLRLVDAEDAATRLIDDNPSLTDDEQATLAALTFSKPRDTGKESVRLSRQTAENGVREQRDQHAKDRKSHEDSVLATIRAYRNIDERTGREIDDTIDSLPALLAIHDQLIADDLPRARSKWLEKLDKDMNSQLHALLVQIDVDRQEISRGLTPINSVLAEVPFRENSVLSIESIERPSSDLKEFRSIVTRYTSNSLTQDLARDIDQIEKAFVGLRRNLARLEDPSRASDAWRRRVFDAREHVEFRAIEARADGAEIVHEGVSGMSGGEGQELIAFILGAALRYRLGEGSEAPPTYASIVLDEGFVKADSDYTGRALAALRALGFQLIVGAPREKATAFEDHVDTVAYINSAPGDAGIAQIFHMTIEEALQLEDEMAS
jgi:uncharacterized protein YPO0396